METLQVKAIKFNGYKIELSTNLKGKPVARYSKLLTVGKNKGTYKLIEGYYFSTEESREEWVKKTISIVKSRVEAKNNDKVKKEEIRNNFVNPFKVGEIFYDSWGYDQTNIDFYEIVEVKAKSVMLQKIGQTMVSEGTFMCEYVKPNPDKKLGEPVLKPVQFRIYNDNISYHINGYRGSISKYDAGERGLYQSHYA